MKLFPPNYGPTSFQASPINSQPSITQKRLYLVDKIARPSKIFSVEPISTVSSRLRVINMTLRGSSLIYFGPARILLEAHARVQLLRSTSATLLLYGLQNSGGISVRCTLDSFPRKFTELDFGVKFRQRIFLCKLTLVVGR